MRSQSELIALIQAAQAGIGAGRKDLQSLGADPLKEDAERILRVVARLQSTQCTVVINTYTTPVLPSQHLPRSALLCKPSSSTFAQPTFCSWAQITGFVLDVVSVVFGLCKEFALLCNNLRLSGQKRDVQPKKKAKARSKAHTSENDGS